MKRQTDYVWLLFSSLRIIILMYLSLIVWQRKVFKEEEEEDIFRQTCKAEW